MYILYKNILKSLFSLSGNNQKTCIETITKTNLSEKTKWWKQKTQRKKENKRKWHRKLKSEKEVLKPAKSLIRLKLNGLIITIQHNHS